MLTQNGGDDGDDRLLHSSDSKRQTRVRAEKRYYGWIGEGGEEVENKTANLLPKIGAHGGTVHRQFVRCGKVSCKCARGHLHGAYYYHFVRVNGKLTKRYLKPEQVEPLRAACLSQREAHRTRRQHTRQNRLMIRDMNARFRVLMQQLKAITGD